MYCNEITRKRNVNYRPPYLNTLISYVVIESVMSLVKNIQAPEFVEDNISNYMLRYFEYLVQNFAIK